MARPEFEQAADMQRPYADVLPVANVPVHIDAIVNHLEQNIAYARSHLTSAEELLRQFKQALGR